MTKFERQEKALYERMAHCERRFPSVGCKVARKKVCEDHLSEVLRMWDVWREPESHIEQEARR